MVIRQTWPNCGFVIYESHESHHLECTGGWRSVFSTDCSLNCPVRPVMDGKSESVVTSYLLSGNCDRLVCLELPVPTKQLEMSALFCTR
jgi:hypothetical protein